VRCGGGFLGYPASECWSYVTGTAPTGGATAPGGGCGPAARPHRRQQQRGGCSVTSVFIIRGLGKKRDNKGNEYDFDRCRPS
jgi:hypothetical protein